MNKKNQLGSLQTIILTLVIIGIILGIGFLILSEFKDTFTYTSHTVANETVAAATTSTTFVINNLTTANMNCYRSFAVITILNGSAGGGVIPTNNYTVVSNTGQIINTSTSYKDKAWNVTYTYEDSTNGCESMVTTSNAMAKIPAWLSIIVILLIVGILLAIVFGLVPKMGGASGGMSWGHGGSGGTIAEI